MTDEKRNATQVPEDWEERIAVLLDAKLKDMATKEDLTKMATKEDLTVMATKEDLTVMATKEDLTVMATRLESLERSRDVFEAAPGNLVRWERRHLFRETYKDKSSFDSPLYRY